MRFGDALTAIQSATLTEVKNDNPKKMSIGGGDGEIIIAISQSFNFKGGKMRHFLYRDMGEYTSYLPWLPTQAQMFSNDWKLV